MVDLGGRGSATGAVDVEMLSATRKMQPRLTFDILSRGWCR